MAAIQDDAFGLSLTKDKPPSKANANETLPRPTAPDYLYTVEPLRVIDGDTIDVRVDLGFEVYARVHYLNQELVQRGLAKVVTGGR